ncbi:MAG TPA: hypothetical protein VII95_11640 [Terriglobales bacterium]|jgi:predicted transcriptional regulator
MANKPYREAYEAAANELEALLEEQERIEGRILSLRKSMNALAQLIAEYEGKDVSYTDYPNAHRLRELLLHTSITADIRRIMTASGETLTTSDVREELDKLGGSLAEQSNPLATINAILNRLQQQGFVVETAKDGRKAWQRAVHPGAEQVARQFTRPTVGQRVLRGHLSVNAAKDKK